MASGKRKRKAARQTRKQTQAGKGPFRHPDGDRRRRGGLTADQAIKQKQAIQQFPGVILPDNDGKTESP
jgi:hypothetical protein